MPICLPSFAGVAQPASGGTPFANQYSVSFDGSDDYAPATLGSQVFDGDFSISAWFNASTSPEYVTLLQLGDHSLYTDGWRLYRNYSQIQFWVGVGGYSLILEGGSTAASSWHHVAITRSGTTCTLYLNGSSTDTGTSSEVFTSTAFKISFTSLPFNGFIDEVALWDSALSSANVTSIFNSGVPNDISSLSPVNWWRMGDNDGASGTTITDQGSGSNDATLTNGPTFSTNVPYILPSITNTYSISFDGTDDYATATLGSQVFDGDFSISAWFNADTAPAYTTLIQSGSNSGYNDGFRIYRYSNTALAFWKGQGGYSNIFGNIGTTATGSWHHIVVTRSGTTSTFYLNGSSIDTGTDSQSYTSTAFQMSFTTYPLDGLMDEVALWDSALSSTDITDIYNSGTPADISSLSPVNWWRMGDNDGGTGTTITDQGSGGNDGTLTNGPTFSTDVPS